MASIATILYFFELCLLPLIQNLEGGIWASSRLKIAKMVLFLMFKSAAMVAFLKFIVSTHTHVRSSIICKPYNFFISNCFRLEFLSNCIEQVLHLLTSSSPESVVKVMDQFVQIAHPLDMILSASSNCYCNHVYLLSSFIGAEMNRLS